MFVFPPTRLSEKQRARLSKPVLPVQIFKRLCVTGKQNGAVELCLGGLLAGTVAAIPNLTRGVLFDTTHSKCRTYLASLL